MDCSESVATQFTSHVPAQTVTWNSIQFRTLDGRSFEVLISDKSVLQQDYNSIAVPDGFRAASPNDGRLAWLHSHEFRAALLKAGGGWTLQVRLGSSGYRRINRNGSSSAISLDSFDNLTMDCRESDFRGNSRVALIGDDDYIGGRLFVDANMLATDDCKVICIREIKNTDKPVSRPLQLKPPVYQKSQLLELSRSLGVDAT